MKRVRRVWRGRKVDYGWRRSAIAARHKSIVSRPGPDPTRGLAGRRKVRDANAAGVYRRRRAMAGALLFLCALMVVSASFSGSSDAGRAAPVDPETARPDAVLAEVEGVDVSTPVRPTDLTGLGYHPEGEGLLEMEPRGTNASTNPILGMVLGGSTPERIRYRLMDPAGRPGPRTGALDVGAGAGDGVYAPVAGAITAIRPDLIIQDANIVEIKPSRHPDLRVYVSLVRNISDNTGVGTPVEAGKTELGIVADSAAVLDPQLSSYTGEAGNHVTVSATRVD